MCAEVQSYDVLKVNYNTNILLQIHLQNLKFNNCLPYYYYFNVKFPVTLKPKITEYSHVTLRCSL